MNYDKDLIKECENVVQEISKILLSSYDRIEDIIKKNNNSDFFEEEYAYAMIGMFINSISNVIAKFANKFEDEDSRKSVLDKISDCISGCILLNNNKNEKGVH